MSVTLRNGLVAAVLLIAALTFLYVRVSSFDTTDRALTVQERWERCWEGDGAICLELGLQAEAQPGAKLKDPAVYFLYACSNAELHGCEALWRIGLARENPQLIDKAAKLQIRYCRSGQQVWCEQLGQRLEKACQEGMGGREMGARYLAVARLALPADSEPMADSAGRLLDCACGSAIELCAPALKLALQHDVQRQSVDSSVALRIFQHLCGQAGADWVPAEGRSRHREDLCYELAAVADDTLADSEASLRVALWSLACARGSMPACGQAAALRCAEGTCDAEGRRQLHHACLAGTKPQLPLLAEAVTAIASGSAPATATLNVLPEGCLWLLKQTMLATSGADPAAAPVARFLERQAWHDPAAPPRQLSSAQRSYIAEVDQRLGRSELEERFAVALSQAGIFVDPMNRCAQLRSSAAVATWAEYTGQVTALCRSNVVNRPALLRSMLLRPAADSEPRYQRLDLSGGPLSNLQGCLLLPGAVTLPLPGVGLGREHVSGASGREHLKRAVLAAAQRAFSTPRVGAPSSGHGACRDLKRYEGDLDADGVVDFVVEARCGEAGRPARLFCRQTSKSRFRCLPLADYDVSPTCAEPTPASSTTTTPTTQ